MKRAALILVTAVAGLASLCAGLLTYGYVVFRDTPERPYRSQGPNAAWADHKWVAAVQPLQSYASFATALRRNRITDLYVYMGWPEPDGSIPADQYSAAPYMLREIRAQQPALRLYAWIGQVERRGGGTLDLSDAEVRRRVTATAGRFLALGFDGIHYSFPGAGSGNAHLLMLLDQTRNLMQRAGSLLVRRGIASGPNVRPRCWRSPAYQTVVWPVGHSKRGKPKSMHRAQWQANGRRVGLPNCSCLKSSAQRVRGWTGTVRIASA
jgi:hypothetical protein